MFGRRKPISIASPPRATSIADEKPEADFLRMIGVHQHATIVGMLTERHILITNNSLYVVDGNFPEVSRILHIDSGLMWIALAIRLRGDVPAAEDALREAIWRYSKLVGAEMAMKGTADIDLSVGEIMIDDWQKNPDDWLMDTLSNAFHYLHPNIVVTPSGIGSIWRDAWRLYAGMLSVLGDATSRRVPGDSDDYW